MLLHACAAVRPKPAHPTSVWYQVALDLWACPALQLQLLKQTQPAEFPA
jgi:hypothetical protein